jgi:hypothetical protein
MKKKKSMKIYKKYMGLQIYWIMYLLIGNSFSQLEDFKGREFLGKFLKEVCKSANFSYLMVFIIFFFDCDKIFKQHIQMYSFTHALLTFIPSVGHTEVELNGVLPCKIFPMIQPVENSRSISYSLILFFLSLKSLRKSV